MKYAILGFGTAGYHAVRNIRKYDPDGQIDVYSETGEAPYNPMLTTYYIYGKLDRSGMYPYGDIETIQQELNFNFIKEKVLHLHAAEKAVETAAASRSYDKILVATGARAFAPPVAGLAPENTYVMRTTSDADRLKERLDGNKPRTAIVVGASMVGIKVVELLNRAGVETWLLGRSPYIFPRAAFPRTAVAIQGRVEKQGVHIHFGAAIDHIEEENGEPVAILSDGAHIQADLVVLCAGTRTNVEFAKGELEINSGIIVNDHMETSVPGIYAAGDCCEGNNRQSGQNQVIGLWANANHQGDTAGANMVGHDSVYKGNIIHNITHFMDMDFIAFGDTRVEGEVLEYGSPESGLYVCLVIKDGRIAAANILDNYKISGIVKNYMLRLFDGENTQLPAFQKGMLVKAGLSRSFIAALEEKLNG